MDQIEAKTSLVTFKIFEGKVQIEPWVYEEFCTPKFKYYVEWKGSAAMLTSIQSASVAPEVNPRITQVKKSTRDLPWLRNPGQMSLDVQNRGKV